MKTLYLSLLITLCSLAAFSQQFNSQNSNVQTGVSLSGFDAVKNNNAVQLSWAAEDENNMSAYEIEKSANGSSFSPIGTITAQNNTLSKYTFSDATRVEGKNYYRLRTSDKRGNVSYSKIVMEDNSYRKTDVLVLSNPVRSGALNLQLSNFSRGKYSISLYSNTGLKVFARSMDLSEGTTTEIINLPSNLGRGSYFVQVTDGINRINKQVILQ